MERVKKVLHELIDSASDFIQLTENNEDLYYSFLVNLEIPFEPEEDYIQSAKNHLVIFCVACSFLLKLFDAEVLEKEKENILKRMQNILKFL